MVYPSSFPARFFRRVALATSRTESAATILVPGRSFPNLLSSTVQIVYYGSIPTLDYPMVYPRAPNSIFRWLEASLNADAGNYVTSEGLS